MIRRLLFAFLFVLFASAALGQQRYTVTLRFDADDDPEVITRQLAATYRLQVDPAEAGTATITVTATDSAIALLRTDRRVVAVETARPSVVATNAAGFGTYAYDGAGNITQVGDDTFDYDKHGRIKNATIANVKQTFTYDRWGNITKIATAEESDLSIGVATNNRLSSASYDDSGNLTSYHGGTFVYDALNVVKESTPTGGNRHLYLYSASNERIATIELVGAQRQYEWTVRDDAGKVLRRFTSLNNAWAWNEDYIYRGNLLLAAEVPSPEKVRHFHLDHLGTPRLITGNGGAVIATRSYGAFGRGLHVESTPAPDELAQFTGHERDNFQLDYMHARYYDPMMGRFLAVDPARSSGNPTRPGTWNRYGYAENNPILKTDPDGRQAAIPLPGTPAPPVTWALDHARRMNTDDAYRQAQVDAVQRLPQQIGSNLLIGAAMLSLLLPRTLTQPVIDAVERKQERRVMIGESMDRVREAAPQIGAAPLALPENSRNAIQGSVLAVQGAVAAKARIFDSGYDPSRALDPSLPYVAERRALYRAGLTPVPRGQVQIELMPTQYYEWVPRTAPR